jgi:hypothetical protein
VSHLAIPHQATRLIFDADQSCATLRARYEAVVPALDPRRPGDSYGRHARAPDVVTEADMSAQHGFFLYWRAEMTTLITEEGEPWPCTRYLMGNRALADDIYRQDPGVMLYAPLNTLIYLDSEGRTRFAVDQPSTVFAAFGDPAIAELGLDLDGRLAELLDALGIQASSLLGAARPALAASSPSSNSR